MIYLNMHGQLGNQMFQYAFARYIQEMTGEQISISYYCVEKMGWKGSLEFFALENITVDSTSNYLKSKTTFSQKIIGGSVYCLLLPFKSKEYIAIRCKIQLGLQRMLNNCGLYWLDRGYREPYASKVKNIIINGQYEDYRYFAEIREKLKEEFQISEKVKLRASTTELISQILSTDNSVCIAVRRGDFLTEENKKYFYLCTEDYYKKAIAKMKEILPNAKFFVFSNDIEWAKDNLGLSEDAVYEDSQNSVIETFALMKSCKHFIISNSTFHWWAQYLSDVAGKDKVVIGPTRWSNQKVQNGLIQDEWIKIDV